MSWLGAPVPALQRQRRTERPATWSTASRTQCKPCVPTTGVTRALSRRAPSLRDLVAPSPSQVLDPSSFPKHPTAARLQPAWSRAILSHGYRPVLLLSREHRPPLCVPAPPACRFGEVVRSSVLPCVGDTSLPARSCRHCDAAARTRGCTVRRCAGPAPGPSPYWSK